MGSASKMTLCGQGGCRRNAGHAGGHNPYPTEAWDFFDDKDKAKLSKAGFATPRGGRKGAYQNHVLRSNQVIIPYERVTGLDLSRFADGYIIRLLPEQYFIGQFEPRNEFLQPSEVRVGDSAFVLYRSHESFESLPPMPDWYARRLLKDGSEVAARGEGVVDDGHYVLRLPRTGAKPQREEGPPQGVFAPEYADMNDNYLCKCVLAWLIIKTSGSPYTTNQAEQLHVILGSEDLGSEEALEHLSAVRRGMTCCPLCLRFVRYNELHDMVSFEDESSLENAPLQIEGTTRSTIVNLFHLEPLVYSDGHHIPQKVTWGHAVCNTRLGQRRCYSLRELQLGDLKVGIIHENGIDTFGWISGDSRMIRSPGGAVWIQLQGDDMDENT